MTRREAGVEHERLSGRAIFFQIGVESRHHRVGGIKREFRGTGLARQSALKGSGIRAVEFNVGLQTLVGRWARLECENADGPAFLTKENRGHPDIGAHIEHAISVVQFNAVLQVAARAEHFAMDETRFIRVQGKYFQTIGKSESSHHDGS